MMIVSFIVGVGIFAPKKPMNTKHSLGILTAYLCTFILSACSKGSDGVSSNNNNAPLDTMIVTIDAMTTGCLRLLQKTPLPDNM
jgi:hypothetical protein